MSQYASVRNDDGEHAEFPSPIARNRLTQVPQPDDSPVSRHQQEPEATHALKHIFGESLQNAGYALSAAKRPKEHSRALEDLQVTSRIAGEAPIQGLRRLSKKILEKSPRLKLLSRSESSKLGRFQSDRETELKELHSRTTYEQLLNDGLMGYDEDARPISTPRPASTYRSRQALSAHIVPGELASALTNLQRKQRHGDEDSEKDSTRSLAQSLQAQCGINHSRVEPLAQHSSSLEEEEIIDRDQPVQQYSHFKNSAEAHHLRASMGQLPTLFPVAANEGMYLGEWQDEVPRPPVLEPLRLPSITPSISKELQMLSIPGDRHPHFPPHFSARDGSSEALESVLSPSRWLRGVPLVEFNRALNDNARSDLFFSKYNDTSTPLAPDHSLEGARSLSAGTVVVENDKHFRNYIQRSRPHLLSPTLDTAQPSREVRKPPQVGKDHRGMKSDWSSTFPRPYHQQYSSFASSKIPQTWGRVVSGGASSIYSSQRNSIMSSPEASGLHTPIIHHVLLRRSFGDYPMGLLLESPIGFQKMINNGLDTRPVQDLRSASLENMKLTDANMADGLLGKASLRMRILRFQQGLPREDSIQSRQLSGNDMAGLDGDTNGWDTAERSSERAFQPNSDPDKTVGDNGSSVWEKALRNHAQEAARRRSVSPLLKSPTSIWRRASRASSLMPPKEYSPTRKDSTIEVSNQDLFRDDRVAPTSAGSAKLQKRVISNSSACSRISTTPSRGRGRTISLNISTASWSKYPSHTRNERTSSAGSKDLVVTRDFAVQTEISAGNTSDKVRMKRKSRSLNFGKNVMKRLDRLRYSHSVDFKQTITGHRSSVAVGGFLQYPELELLPPIGLQYDLPAPSEDEEPVESEDSDKPKLRRSKPLKQSWGESKNAGEVEIPTNAQVWSDLYHDCVDFPKTENASTAAATPLRASTMDFKESLEAAQRFERDKLLRETEEAWGKSSKASSKVGR